MQPSETTSEKLFRIYFYLTEVPQLQPYKQEADLDEDEELGEDKYNEDQSSNDHEESNRGREDRSEDEDEEDRRESESTKNKKKNKAPQTPKIVDPYANDETSYLLPILITIGAFIPLLYCLCRL